MKRFIGILLSVVFIIGMIAVPAGADGYKVLEMNFDGENYDGSCQVNANYGTVSYVGKTSDTDTDKAMLIQSTAGGGEIFYTGYKPSVTAADAWDGISALSFDFMVPKDFCTSNNNVGILTLQFKNSDYSQAQKSAQIVRLLKESGVSNEDDNCANVRIGIRDYTADKTKEDCVTAATLPTEVWHNIKFVIDPANAKFRCIITKNGDDSNMDNIYTGEFPIFNGNPTSTATPAEISGKTAVDRFYFSSTRANSKYYIDNFRFEEIGSDLSLVSSAPAADAVDVAVQPTISYTFNKAVDSFDFKINGNAANFTKSSDGTTLSYTPSSKLANSTEYTVSGVVKDSTGMIYKIDRSFTTIAKHGKSTVNPYEYNYNFDGGKSEGFFHGTNIADIHEFDDNTVLKLQKQAGVGYSEWRLWAWGNKQNIVGDMALSFDMRLDCANQESASASTNFLQFVWNTSGTDVFNSSTDLMKMVYEDSKWKIGFKTGYTRYDYLYTDIDNGTWQTISLVFHPSTACFDVLLGDRAVRYKITTGEENVYATPSSTNTTWDVRFVTNSADTIVYIDNISIKKSLAMDGAYFEDGNGTYMTDDNGKAVVTSTDSGIYYVSDIVNGSKQVQKISLAVCEYNNNKLVQIRFMPLSVPANGTLSVREGFNTVKNGSKVKAFYLDVDGISPFRSDALDLLEITIQ